jgi:transcriptional regulator with XRE-family HTH domain
VSKHVRPSQSHHTVFGARLRQSREKLGLSQEQVGVLIGIDESSASARISRYESGTHEAPHLTASLIARALGVPAAYLYCEDDTLAAIILAADRLSKGDRLTVLESMQTRLNARLG